MALELKGTPVFDKLSIAWQKYPIIALQGGSRSSKTHSIFQKLCVECFNADSPLEIVIGGRTLQWLKMTAFKDFKDILTNEFGCWNDNNWNGGRQEYTLNGSKILFVGFDGERGKQKAHGLASDICFLNEANFLSHNIYKQLHQRNRHKMILDFNPGFTKKHWIVQSVLRDDNRCLFFRSTFRDNPFLTEDQVKTIEGYEPTEYNIAKGTADETYWKIYGLGEMAVVQGRVFPVFKELSNEDWPKFQDWEKFRYGMDFGFSNDPSTLCDVSLLDGKLYLKERLYETGLTAIENPKFPDQPSIEGRFKQIGVKKNYKIWADNSRPEIIKSLANCGYCIGGATKGKGSIIQGINFMKHYPLVVHADSYNLINELMNYKWKEDRDGKTLNEPVDAFNHGIDGVRYAAFMDFRPKNSTSPRYCNVGNMRTGSEKYDAFG